VYFANGTSKLTSSSKTKISTLAPSARSASAVFVGGFSGNTSKDKANQIRLAQGRAVNTRAALRDAGVGTTITIWSYGRTGAVTSGNFSPVLGHGIAMAFLPPDLAIGSEVTIDVRGSELPGTVVPLPFVAKH